MKVVLPVKDNKQKIQTFYANNFCMATTRGLVKDVNEDRIGFAKFGSSTLKFVVADSHWGEEAAVLVMRVWASSRKLISNRAEAVSFALKIQSMIYKKFGHCEMDEEKDRTSESSYVAAEIKQDRLILHSYGDSLAFLVRNGHIIHEQQVEKTWLGAFSFLGLRARMPVLSATKFDQIKLERGDVLLLMTDGVTECKYETPVISKDEIAKLCSLKPEVIVKKLMQLVFGNGAEDNASLIVFKVGG